MTNGACALCGEPIEDARPGVRVRLDDSERSWTMDIHAACLDSLLRANLRPLSEDRPSPMPRDAACGVCGKRLPIVGRHPYALTVERAGAAQAWFVHDACLPDALRARIAQGGGP